MKISALKRIVSIIYVLLLLIIILSPLYNTVCIREYSDETITGGAEFYSTDPTIALCFAPT